MADKYIKYVNGNYVEISESEIDEIKLANQKELLANATKYELAQEDIMLILAQQVSITLPNGQKETADKLVNAEIDLPFKLGYKWELQGTTFVLVKDDNAIGTQTNPIIYEDGVQLLDNAFYKKDGVIQVYMSGQWIEWQ